MGIRAITFDVYSALYDTVSGLEQALRALLQTRGTGGDPAALARVWRQRHMEYLLIANSLDREPARNRTALEASARHPLAALRPPLSRDDLLHIAGSATDAAGATAFGIRTVWVNRSGSAVLDPRFAPAHDVKDLNGVLEILD